MEKIRIFTTEFHFQTARSSGAGGQHVNKVETKVIAKWHLENTLLLTPEEISHVKGKLAKSIDNEGFIQVQAQEKRTQIENKKIAIEKLNELIRKGLKMSVKRKVTLKPKGVKERILKTKAIRSEIKTMRQKPNFSEED